MKNRRERVLAVITTPFYREKGSSMRVHSILSLLGEEYEVDAVTYPHGRDVEINEVTIHRTVRWFAPTVGIGKASVRRILLDVLVLLQALKLALRKRYAIIHCEDFEALAIGRIVRLVRPRTKLVYDMHNPLPDNLNRTGSSPLVVRLARILDWWALRGVDLVILNWGIYQSVPRYPNRSNFVYYDRVTLESTAWRRDIDTPFIVYAGNFEGYQGVEILLDAYEKASPSIKLVVIGALPKRLEERINAGDFGDGVIAMGSLDVPRTNDLIGRALAFAVPRIDDSRIPSMKLVHAVVNGTPVIASDRQCNHELLRDGYNAAFYQSSGDLSELLTKIGNDPTALASLERGVQETRDMILQSWSSERFLREYRRGIANLRSEGVR